MKTLIFLFPFILLNLAKTFGQESDSSKLAQELDSLSHLDTDSVSEINADIIYHAVPDSSTIIKRSFSEKNIQELKSDKELNYTEAPTVAESLWDRFLMWISQIINRLFVTAVNTNWGRVVVYVIGLIILIILIMMILKVNAFKVLYSGAGKNLKYQVLDENIHEMDFDQLIQESIDQHNYRRGIRLLFLYALKLLSDRHLIQWESGKTNHDYVGELNKNELKTGLNELSFYFEYAWYGNFRINHETFQKAQDIFSDWRSKLNQ